MDELLILIIKQYGWIAITSGFLISLILESAFDVLSEFFVEWLRGKLKARRVSKRHR